MAESVSGVLPTARPSRRTMAPGGREMTTRLPSNRALLPAASLAGAAAAVDGRAGRDGAGAEDRRLEAGGGAGFAAGFFVAGKAGVLAPAAGGVAAPAGRAMGFGAPPAGDGCEAVVGGGATAAGGAGGSLCRAASADGAASVSGNFASPAGLAPRWSPEPRR